MQNDVLRTEVRHAAEILESAQRAWVADTDDSFVVC